LTCLFALKRIVPRAIINDSVPAEEFSLARALDHLKIISEKPHFVSSSAHEEVREYLVAELKKLGLEVEIQEAEVLGQKNRTGTKVRNILARIEGSEPGKALMLLSHYDSEVSTSFGASDAGSGVVVILSDTVISDQRHLRVSIGPNRAINRVDIRLKKDTRVLSLEVQQEKAFKTGNTPFLVSDKGSRSLFRYYFSDAGEPLEFSYVIPLEDDPSLFLFELTYDFQNLPEIKKIKPEILPRPGHLMPNTFFVSDAVLNLREIKF
jgi:hypothetical protein